MTQIRLVSIPNRINVKVFQFFYTFSILLQLILLQVILLRVILQVIILQVIILHASYFITCRIFYTFVLVALYVAPEYLKGAA